MAMAYGIHFRMRQTAFRYGVWLRKYWIKSSRTGNKGWFSSL